MPADERSAVSHVTPHWWRRVGPWLGIGGSPIVLMVGGGVSEGNERGWLVAAIILGAAGLTALAVAQGEIGRRRRARFPKIAAETLGVRGSRFLASPVIALMMVGWFGFNSAVAGAGLGRLIGAPDRVGVLIFAVVMLAIAWWGLNVLAAAALVAGIATIILAGEGLSRALEDRHGPLLGDGVPATQLGFLAAVTIVVGYGAAFALWTPDFTHDLRRGRDVVWCGVLGLMLPLALFAFAGGVLSLVTGTWDLVEVLERIGSPTLAYAFVTIGISGSVLTTMHSAAIAIEDLTGRLSHRAGLLVDTTLGTGLAMLDFTSRMVPFLTVMAVAAPCLIGVMLVRRRPGGTGRPGHASAVVAWVVGGVVGGVLAVLEHPAALPVGIALAAAVAWATRPRGRPSTPATAG